jgi:adenosylcobinamide-phosphate synthase
MFLIALIIALLIEQLLPLPTQQVVIEPLRGLAARLAERLNGGRVGDGWLAWALAVLPAVALTAVVGHFLAETHGLLGLVFMVAALYLTLDAHSQNQMFSDIHLALLRGEIERARALLGEWRQECIEDEDKQEIACLAIEHALTALHRNVFGLLFWFAVLGPAGAVMYRLARFFEDEWGRRQDEGYDHFGQCARQAFEIIDWIPLRLTALSFAVAGNFEDAILCWRTQAARWPERELGILVASGAGALGVRLGGTETAAETVTSVPGTDEDEDEDMDEEPSVPGEEQASSSAAGAIDRPEVGVGARAGIDNMQNTVGLARRALFVYLLVLALAALAGRVGS